MCFLLFLDISIGVLLGKGAFTTVKEVKTINSGECQQSCEDDDHYFAIKQMRNDLPPFKRKEACFDLESEAELLSVLDHPNIIKFQ